MNCPNCNHEIKDDAKFCTVCGANIEEALETKETEAKEKEDKEKRRKKEQADKKKLEELRKQEQEKQEQLLKEAEKAEAIRQAKEEGIELEIIDEVPEEKEEVEEPKTDEFKLKREETTTQQKAKKKKVTIKKNIFQVILGKILFVIIVAAIICGGLYFCYRNEYLPGFAMDKAREIDQTIQNVIQLNKDIKEIDEGKVSNKESSEFEWEIEATIEADDIKDLTEDYSIIIKNNLYGLISNKDGKIVVEPKYSLIEYGNYTIAGVAEKGIIAKEGEKFYKVNDKFELAGEVTRAESNEKHFFYEHHVSSVFVNNSEGICSKSNTATDNRIEVCTDISIVTTTGVDASSALLPETFSIDFEKSTLGTKGYCNPEKGELIIDCNYQEALPFSEGYAAVVRDGKAGFIDEKGERVKDFVFEATRSVHDKTAFAKENGKWGIVKVK